MNINLKTSIVLCGLVVLTSCGKDEAEVARHNTVANTLRQIETDIAVGVATGDIRGDGVFLQNVRTNFLPEARSLTNKQSILVGIWVKADLAMWRLTNVDSAERALVGAYLTGTGQTNFIAINFDGGAQDCDLQTLLRLARFEKVWAK